MRRRSFATHVLIPIALFAITVVPGSVSAILSAAATWPTASGADERSATQRVAGASAATTTAPAAGASAATAREAGAAGTNTPAAASRMLAATVSAAGLTHLDLT